METGHVYSYWVHVLWRLPTGEGENVEEGYIDCLGLGFVAFVNSSIVDEGALVKN